MLLLNNDQNCPIVNYDVYSEKFRGIHIDAMRECSADHPEDPIDCFTTTDIQFVLYNADDPAVSSKHLHLSGVLLYNPDPVENHS